MISIPTLDAEASEALRTFDEDAAMVCAAARRQSKASAGALHGLARAAYRKALENAAGPGDRSWSVFIRSVASLVVEARVEPSRTRARRAYARLVRLVLENADLLTSDRAAAGPINGQVERR